MTQFHKALIYPPSRKFAEMARLDKIVFLAKLVVCIGTFGFVFPNVQNE
jgi:hypothetical protein